jgi:hypothetical protein
LGKITKIILEFYQISGSFKKADGNLIESTDSLGNLLAPNLFVKDVYLTLGYDVSEFEEEMIKIYSLDSPSYVITASPIENNHKNLQLRWIHKLDDGNFKSITPKDDIDFEIRWYRWTLGAASAD